MSSHSTTTAPGLRSKLAIESVQADASAGLYTEPIRSKARNPPSTLSTRRRLFPFQRPPSSTFTGLRLSGDRNQLPIEWHSQRTFGFDDCQDYLSDGGSSNSSGTVKISALSNLELPDARVSPTPGDDDRADAPCLPCAPLALHKGYGSPVHQPPPNTPNTMNAAAQNEGHAANAALSDYTNKTTRRRVRWNSIAEIKSPDCRLAPEARRSLPDLRAATRRSTHETGEIQKVSSIATDKTPLNDSFHRISMWDTSVKLFTATQLSQNGNIDLHHHAQLSVTIPKQDIPAKRISICLVIANGIGGDRTFRLDRGQSSLFFKDDSSPPLFDRHEAEINIIRETCDAAEPLNIYLSLTYPPANGDPISWLPIFRPANGTVLSESIFIAEPVPPLIIKTFLRSQYSTWTQSQHAPGQVIHFERQQMPDLYPDGLKDDLRIKIVKPPPVLFPSLKGSSASDTAWDLEIKVHKVLGLEIECRMSLWLEIGSANTLLCVDPQEWIPKAFFVENRLATEAGGEWRQHENHLILIKQPHMLPGPIKIEMDWQEPVERCYMDSNCVYQIPLPRVVDRKILYGSFTCERIDGASFSDLEVKDHLFSCDERDGIRLPILPKGSALCLRRVPNRSTPSAVPNESPSDFSSSAKFVNQSMCSEVEAIPILQAHVDKDGEQDDDDDIENTFLGRPSIKALIIQATVLWVIVVVLWIAAYYEHNYSDGEEDVVRAIPSLPGASESGFLDRTGAGTAFTTPAPNGDASGGTRVAQNEGRGEEGWRNWVDTALGWKGHTP